MGKQPNQNQKQGSVLLQHILGRRGRQSKKLSFLYLRAGNLRGQHNFPRGNYDTRSQQNHQRNLNKTCCKCGRHLGPNHLQQNTIPAKYNTCTKCVKGGHFQKVCRSPTVKYKQLTNINQQEDVEVDSVISKTTSTQCRTQN